MTNKDGISVEGLVERLRETWCGHYGMDERHNVNPDGPEAADLILALSERHDDAVKIAHIMTDKANEHCANLLALSEREAAKDAEIAELKGRIAAAINVVEQGYSGPRKTEQCEHGKFGFEDCTACYDRALLAALTKGQADAG